MRHLKAKSRPLFIGAIEAGLNKQLNRLNNKNKKGAWDQPSAFCRLQGV